MMKEIKVTELRKGGDRMDIAEKWDELPIPERIKIAEVAGAAGRVGSSSWKDLHEMDREAILKAHIGESLPITEALLEDSELQPPHPGAIEKIQKAIGTPTPDTATEAYFTPTEPQDYLLWVGWSSYPTIKSFTVEASKMGVSRRISKLPRDLMLGKSRVFLAHDEGETEDAVIFGYFIPTGVEVIVHRNSNGIPDRLKNIAKPITVEQAAEEEERGCGYREDIGSTYLVAYGMTTFKPYKDYNAIIDSNGRRFRGIKKVSDHGILAGPSKKAPSITHKIAEDQKIKRASGTDWTEEERQKLRELTSTMRPWRAIREMHKITGRSIYGIAYQYSKMKRDDREECDEQS